MYINIIQHKKIHPKIPSTTLVLKFIFKISNSVMSIILSWIYYIRSKSSMFIEFFKIIDWMKSKANQIYLKQAKNFKMWCPYITKKFNCRKIIHVTTILGGFSVLSPIDILKMEQTFQMGYREGDKVCTCLLEIERENMI
jgi:hypothetical protein